MPLPQHVTARLSFLEEWYFCQRAGRVWRHDTVQKSGSDHMLTDNLTNPTVKAAIEALQKGDRKAWSALFEPGATLYDDGHPRPLAIHRRCTRA
jgi:hypothetical protein